MDSYNYLTKKFKRFNINCCNLTIMEVYVDLNKLIRDIPDFPKKGIIFKDITTLLSDGEGFAYSIDLMEKRYLDKKIDKIIGIESRGFIFGAALAYKLGCGFIPVRKPGKLPYDSIKEDYSLEYGKNTLEIHTDALKEGERVVIIDDLLATGGTAKAAAKLVSRLKGNIISIDFLVELEFLKGRDKLKEYSVHSYLKY